MGATTTLRLTRRADGQLTLQCVGLHPHHVNVTSVETCPVCMRRLIEHMARIDRQLGDVRKEGAPCL